MELTLINKINPSHLKIFESVYRLKSMTLAAQELFLTQSGVSQHLKRFENELGVVLFVRNRTGLFRTEEADLLYKSYIRCFGQLNEALLQIKNVKTQQLEGTIRIGTPTEFGNNIVMPFVSAWAQRYPGVKFDFIYGYGDSLQKQLEQGEVDLAFIDSFKKNKKINSRAVFQENLNLVASLKYLREKKYLMKPHSKENLTELLSLDFLEYEHKESILRMWFQYHFQKKNINLDIRAWAMNVQGVASLVRQGMGAAILPDHVTEKLLKQNPGSLHIFKGRKTVHLRNQISMVWVKNKPLSHATDHLLTYIIQRNL